MTIIEKYIYGQQLSRLIICVNSDNYIAWSSLYSALECVVNMFRLLLGEVIDATFGASGFWLGTRTGAGGTATLA